MMNRATGQTIAPNAHILQSITDILTTPLGSRVMRRDYGSLLFEFVDQPINDLLRLQLMAATVAAISKWEDRIDLQSVTLELSDTGLVMNLNAVKAETDQDLNFSIPINLGAAA